MKKVLELLERHVQWVAMGLGGVFLLFVAWTYWVNAPVAVEVKGKRMTPGQVELATLEVPVKEVERQIALAEGTKLRIDVPDYVAAFTKRLQGGHGAFPAFPAYAVRSDRSGRLRDGRVGPDEPGSDDGYQIERLPELPAPVIADRRVGRSEVEVVDPNWKAPKRNLNAEPKMIEKDTEWYWAKFKISAEKLRDEWNKAINPDELNEEQLARFYGVEIVNVALYRQERQPDGSWGKEVLVKPLRNDPTRPEFPDEKQAEYAQVTEYKTWLAQNQNAQELINPTFHPVVSGEIPGQEGVTAVGGSGGGTDASTARQQRALEAKMRKEYEKQQREMMKMMRQQGARGAAGPYGGYGGRNPRGPYGGYGGYPPPGAAGRGPATAPNPYGGYGGRNPRSPYGGYPVPRAPGAFQTPGSFGGAGAASFDVSTLEDDLEVVAIDDSVQPGKTYRYRMVYWLSNPLYRVRGTIAAEALTLPWALKSPHSAWTSPVTVPSRVEFYLVQNPAPGAVTVDVLTKRPDGDYTGKRYKLAPGDAIADTGWTVVDTPTELADDGRYALLVDPNGNLVRRDYDTDRQNETYREYLDSQEEARAERGLEPRLAGGGSP